LTLHVRKPLVSVRLVAGEGEGAKLLEEAAKRRRRAVALAKLFIGAASN
jgi:hypothetical protein